MNKTLLSILLICSIGFTQELTVDGNLNVTGNIQNQTIDSLLQVIQSLESQLSALQGGFETRLFELNNFSFSGESWALTSQDFIINDIIGYNNLGTIMIQIISINNMEINTNNFRDITIYFPTDDTYDGGEINHTLQATVLKGNSGDVHLTSRFPSQLILDTNISDRLYVQLTSYITDIESITIAVTAQFPDSNTQQRKPGLQSKDTKTAE